MFTSDAVTLKFAADISIFVPSNLMYSVPLPT